VPVVTVDPSLAVEVVVESTRALGSLTVFVDAASPSSAGDADGETLSWRLRIPHPWPSPVRPTRPMWSA
jgi:hypothetical protein